MFGKKGLSPIIATVLILLLTISAIAIIAGFIVPFIKESLTGATECLPYTDYYKFDDTFDFNCRNQSGVYLTVRSGFPGRGSEYVPDELRLVFLGEGSSQSAVVKQGEVGTDISTLGVPTLEVPANGEIRSYLYSSPGTFKSVEVYPVLESGKICEITDSTAIKLGC